VKLRVATVPYLNVEPFLGALRASMECEVVRAVPSRLARLWLEESTDLCLLSVTAIHGLGLEPLGGAAIGCDGAVRSVRFIANGPPAAWRRVSLDAASSTSNALARLLLEKGYFTFPRFAICREPAADLIAGRSDAALLIGDRALAAPAAPFAMDLGAAWKCLTGLPFVFAAWVEGRRGLIPRDGLEAALEEARRRSTDHIDAAAREHSMASGLDAAGLSAYLRESISYRFGPREKAAMRGFLRLAPLAASWPASIERPVEGGHACASS
jgi:chorismate dehydratase